MAFQWNLCTALAGVVAVEHMQGPKIAWKGGRTDKPVSEVPPPNRLPDHTQGAAHVRQVFSRMGFSAQETVALMGAHSMGKLHLERSNVNDSKWAHSTTICNNYFFRNLVGMKWTRKTLTDGTIIFEAENGMFRMLLTDMAMLQDPQFRPWTQLYAKDNDKWRQDFAAAFAKLISNGCNS